MTPDQMAELAERLRYFASKRRREFGKSSLNAAEFDRAADLIEQRVPMTDEQIWSLWEFPADLSWKESVIKLGHAVEQAHGIKEQSDE